MVPVEIILDDSNNVLKFGFECLNFIKSKGINCGHYFKDIILNIYDNKTTITPVNSSKIFPLIFVIQKVFEIIKALAIKEILRIRPFLKEDKIKWVSIIPSTWNEDQKEIIMKSSMGANMLPKNYIEQNFVLESEAVSLYCSQTKQNEYYIICNLGNESSSIVAHLVGNNSLLYERFPYFSKELGSNRINKYFFEDIILKLFGCQDFDTFYSKYVEKNGNNNSNDIKAELFNEWTELEREVNDYKNSINKKKIENKENYPISFSVFREIFDDGIDLNDLVKKYNNQINDYELFLSVGKNKRKWIVELPYKIIYNYLKYQAESIFNKINEINSKLDIKGIIFVGNNTYNNT